MTPGRLRRALPWFLGYAIALVRIAFWSEYVDKGAGVLLTRLTELVPILTCDRIEFGSNIFLFVPLGSLLTMLIPRLPRAMVEVSYPVG
ncbi:hypothetical protein [Microbacterium capsulatum]|uniref:Uncharacterized protein n=1 Tax=Microbacterium capsulatum TaxID=3041921 RepID=A0ABU0XGQ9_9MICO|nr:hypothetical protein [Microbacterium sp. ASV81]MDQ4214251.1 hypothetical protein [Microbacterium sp. ASV81]